MSCSRPNSLSPSLNRMDILQSVWEQSQPSLQSAREILSGTPPEHSRILRVGQLDAELLDEELVHVLQEPIGKALAQIRSALKTRYEPELALVIRLALYRMSVWATGASYGAKLQDLRYNSTSSNTSSGLARRVLVLHGALTILVPYAHSRFRQHALTRAWPDAPTSDRRRQAWELLTHAETAHAALTLMSFVAFLWNGRYRTLADRLLGLRLVPATRIMRREVSYEFMNRQMVWHAFTEFLLFVLPLLPRRSMHRLGRATLSTITAPAAALSRLMPSSREKALDLSQSASKQPGLYSHLSDNECAICYENAATTLNLGAPDAVAQSARQASSAVTQTGGSSTEPPTHSISTPYRTSCGHVYCYVCVADRMLRAAEDGTGQWTCLRCAQPVVGVELVCEPMYWTSDGEGEGDEEGSAFESDYFDELGSSIGGVSAISTGSRWSESERSD